MPRFRQAFTLPFHIDAPLPITTIRLRQAGFFADAASHCFHYAACRHAISSCFAFHAAIDSMIFRRRRCIFTIAAAISANAAFAAPLIFSLAARRRCHWLSLMILDSASATAIELNATPMFSPDYRQMADTLSPFRFFSFLHC